jgi:hypothetical protein
MSALLSSMRACALAALLCACTQQIATGGSTCGANGACAAGYACLNGVCTMLCRSDAECGDGRICVADACAPGSRAEPPLITNIDGEGSPDGASGHAARRTNGSIVIHGSSFTGAAVTLADGTRSFTLDNCDVTTERIVAQLPDGLTAGTYQLSVATQAGSCSATLPVLQGERGDIGPPGADGAPGAEGPAGPRPIVEPGAGIVGDGSPESPLAIDFARVAQPHELANQGCEIGDAVSGFDASGAPVCVSMSPSPRLVDRIAHLSAHSGGAVGTAWDFVPSTAVSFYAAGGPVQIIASFPMAGGAHSSCRPLIDGMPAGLFSGLDTSYFWSDGLQITSDGWSMWNSARSYPGVPAGRHLLSFQCHTDSPSSAALLGGTGIIQTVSVVPYAAPAGSEVKAYTGTARGGQTIPSGVFGVLTGLSVAFESTGGPVRISLSIPLSGGQFSMCRPIVDGVPAATGDIDDFASLYQEGILYTIDGWMMWNRTRLYLGIAAGQHTATAECATDGYTLTVGLPQIGASMSVVTYEPSSSPSATVRGYRGVQRLGHAVAAASGWVTLPGLTTAFPSNGGPIEIGVSLSLWGGGYGACHPLIDGQPIRTGELDDPASIWHEGIDVTGDGWILWDRVRVYRGIPAGNHTLDVQCRTDGGTMTAGDSRTVSTAWAVAYDR